MSILSDVSDGSISQKTYAIKFILWKEIVNDEAYVDNLCR